MHGSHNYLCNKDTAKDNDPKSGFWVLLAVSLWHKTSNQSEHSVDGSWPMRVAETLTPSPDLWAAASTLQACLGSSKEEPEVSTMIRLRGSEVRESEMEDY